MSRTTSMHNIPSPSQVSQLFEQKASALRKGRVQNQGSIPIRYHDIHPKPCPPHHFLSATSGKSSNLSVSILVLLGSGFTKGFSVECFEMFRRPQTRSWSRGDKYWRCVSSKEQTHGAMGRGIAQIQSLGLGGSRPYRLTHVFQVPQGATNLRWIETKVPQGRVDSALQPGIHLVPSSEGSSDQSDPGPHLHEIQVSEVPPWVLSL